MKKGPRIIAGNYSGHVIAGIEPGIRPTSERVRKSFFDIMQPRLQGMSMMDVFAGSGIMGFEALSRGASQVVFMEKSPAACRHLKQQVTALKCRNRADVICGDAREHLLTCLARGEHWVVFADPPYNLNIIPDVLALIVESSLKTRIDQIVVEHHHKTDPVGPMKSWPVVRREKYGETNLSFINPPAG